MVGITSTLIVFSKKFLENILVLLLNSRKATAGAIIGLLLVFTIEIV